MKPFDLERALVGDPVVTRSGTTVTEIHYLKTVQNDAQVISVINGDVYFHKKDGKRWCYDEENDLFMVSTKKTGWMNIMKGEGKEWEARVGIIHNSKEHADSNASCDRIACIQIEWEE